MVNTLFFSKRNCLSVDLLTNIILNSILKARTRHQTSEDECRRVTDEFKQMQMSVDESLDQSRRVQTSHQTSVDECRRVTDECRRVTRQVQTNVDASLDECRQMQTSVNKSKRYSLFREKVTHGPILLLLQLCNSTPHRHANFQFCSFICDYYPHNLTMFPLLTLAKPICLLFH